MTTFNTAYETTATIGFVTGKVQTAVKQAAITNETARYNHDNIVMIEGSGTYGEAVPPFSHPMQVLLDADGAKDQKWIAVDMRPFGRYNPDRREFTITGNRMEYALALARARLNLVWIERDKEVLRDISGMPVAVFSSWLSENIQRRFSLEPYEQFQVSIFAGIYYYSLFHNEEKLDERNKMRIANAIQRNMRIDIKEVLKVIDKVDVIPNLPAFCSIIAEHVSPIRLAHLNPAVLITIVGSTWQGNSVNHRELLAVALEHPPTFISILMSAVSERYYHNTQLARICERHTRNDTGKNFMPAVTRMLDLMSNK